MLWLTISFLVALCLFADCCWKRDVNAKWSQVPGPLSLPIIGSIWIGKQLQPDELLVSNRYIRNRFGRVSRFWVLHICYMFICDLHYIQAILSHSTEIRKNRMYSLLTDWLGDGLLVSYGAKWLSRRCVITKTFHFSILEDFVSIFDHQAQILTRNLAKFADGVQVLDIEDAVALATLDVICESAMGVLINAQTDVNCEYVSMQRIIVKRYVTIAYQPKWLFQLLAPRLAQQHFAVTAALHRFTERIIKARREEIFKHQTEVDKNQQEQIRHISIKRRQASLDALLFATIDGKPLTDTDIREEVDAFMFEGHDTIKSATDCESCINIKNELANEFS